MRALIAAGGTGGHIYPGIAVAREIVRRDADADVRFVGTARGLETKLVPQAGFELSLIESAGLVNMGLAARVRGLAVLPKSFIAARRLMREFHPDVVIGAGGYVSGPVLLTAALLKIPTLVMESNAVPGFTNRTLARFVDAAAVSFEAALPFFRGKGVVTGNPIRREFFDVTEKPSEDARFSILIFGGSQGARSINRAMTAALPHLGPHKESLRVTHQTGKLDYEEVRAAYESASWTESADVREYIDEMVEAFAQADLVISRAGATTSFELMAAGRPAIMVPLPGQLEQRKNAEALEQAGAARMIAQGDLTGERLAKEIIALLANREGAKEMGRAARRLARGDAAATTVDLILNLIGKRK